MMNKKIKKVIEKKKKKKKKCKAVLKIQGFDMPLNK